MKCPRCKNELTRISVKEVSTTLELDECKSCEGIWFDEGELQPLEKIIEPVFWETRNIPKDKDQLIEMNCPKCGDLMKKSEHRRDRKVILDSCERCKGIWLDKGELEAIQKENIVLTIKNLITGK